MSHPRKLLLLRWCFTKVRKQWFTHSMATPISLILSLDFLQRDTLAPYQFVIWLDYVLHIWIDYVLRISIDYVLRISIDLITENGFTFLKKTRNRRYPAEIITDADYADDQVLLVNTPSQTKFQLHNLEKVARRIFTWTRI